MILPNRSLPFQRPVCNHEKITCMKNITASTDNSLYSCSGLLVLNYDENEIKNHFLSKLIDVLDDIKESTYYGSVEGDFKGFVSQIMSLNYHLYILCF